MKWPYDNVTKLGKIKEKSSIERTRGVYKINNVWALEKCIYGITVFKAQ